MLAAYLTQQLYLSAIIPLSHFNGSICFISVFLISWICSSKKKKKLQLCLLSARVPATHAESIRKVAAEKENRDNICHLSWSSAANPGKIKTTLAGISYLGEGKKPNNFPCCCLEQRLLADAPAVIPLHIWASVTECDSGRQGEGKTRLRFSCSRMTGCRLDTRLADGISKSFHEPSGMCTMITNHTYNKARRAAPQGGWGERAGGKKGGKKRKPRGTNSVTFPRHRTPGIISTRALSQPGTTAPSLCVHRPAPSQATTGAFC